ncbi:MAG: MTAP family purine nucleoside phosphorylase [Candidatus Micrarchaeota archaeon]|nr:MTAP family purine nucleoside phosphorylase [Candidatus Micrarchaeota archaeon]
MLGVISGTGLYNLLDGERKPVRTPYGEAEVFVSERTAFIPRHGKSHKIPPHAINHRANIWALHSLGVSAVISFNAAGALSKYEFGDMVLVEDFVCFFPLPTFFDTFAHKPVHVGMSPPYSERLRKCVLAAAKKARLKLKKGGVLAHTAGPRFETNSECRALSKLGANLVGMTSVPECILCNELKMAHANVCIVTNDSHSHLSMEGIIRAMQGREQDLRELAMRL